MANEIIKNEIIGTLESLVELTANVTETHGTIHQIDIDLLQEHIRKLYHKVQLLDEANRQMLNAGMQVKSAPTHVQPETPVEVKQEVVVEKPIETDSETPLPIIEPIVEIPKENPVEITSQNHTLAEKVTEVVQYPISENKGGELHTQPLTIAEKLQKQDNSINQQLMSNNTVRNEKLTGSPIQNLKTAIGINDKFIFVNELFKGEMNEYETALGLINDASSEETAISILHENLQKRGTFDKTEIRMKLERFIQRRFAK